MINKRLLNASLQQFKSLRLFTYSVRMMSNVSAYSYETLQIASPSGNVLHVELNRPDKRNAMNRQFFVDIRNCFKQIGDDPSAHAVVLSGAGKHFTTGLDLMDFIGSLTPDPDADVGRRAFELRRMIADLQESFSVVEKCRQPVIAAVHSACIGGAIDLMCACDIRMCASDAWFSIKEVDIGLAADLGTLQRLPKIMGNHSLIRELAYTARPMMSDEARREGFVSHVYESKEEMMKRAIDLATEIASKSPVAVAATKLQLNYGRDHTVEEGLDYIASWNMGLLQSKDLAIAGAAFMQKQTPKFDDMKSKL